MLFIKRNDARGNAYIIFMTYIYMTYKVAQKSKPLSRTVIKSY